MAKETSLLTTIDGRIATVTLNRPESLNALNAALAAELGDTLNGLARNADVRCVVLTGAGGHFMAGGDITFFREKLPQIRAAGSTELEPLFEDVHAIIRAIRSMPQPVIASASGAIAGFGLSLLMACDLAVAADDSVFTLAYCHIGASPDGSSTYFLPRVVGFKRAMELALLGDRFDAARAFDLGLVNRVVPEQEREAVTLELAQRLARGPAKAYARTKALLNSSLEDGLDVQLDAERDAFIACAQTDDFAEGVTAFCEKRKPSFV
ncbi:MAG: enoyl-CoA hydratase [Gammaproteobacteria bacterium]|nr:enoyl-CoA hydratase [Gammaproteobacteria bacterium]